MSRRSKLKLALILLVPITILLNIITERYPGFIERYYSTTLNKMIRQALSFITAPFPTSAAELLVISLVIVLIAYIVLIPVKVKKREFLNHFLSMLAYLSVLYLAFMFSWGFNYNRFSFDRIAGLDMRKSTVQELYELCEELLQRANTVRMLVEENDQGVMVIPGGYRSVFKRAASGFERAAELYPELGGRYGPPKRILLSERMSYTGITGIYMPYTGEPNVNINTTNMMLPCTTTHEMAHQRGFAREDEANYIAYVTCIMHPDPDFQYSGIMLALINSMNALASRDMKAYGTLVGKYSEGLKRDLKYERTFWDKYAGKVEQVASNVNNAYLKSNGQEDGVQSYGRMVDLLLAERRSKITN
jgi:hypothetical protein